MRKGYTETMPKRSHDDEGMPIYGAPVGARTAGSQGTTRSEIETVTGFMKVRVLVQQEGDGSWVATVPTMNRHGFSRPTKHGAIKAACDAVSIDATSASDSGSDPGRERVAAWMRGQGFATGSDSTLEALLRELVWQAGEMGD